MSLALTGNENAASLSGENPSIRAARYSGNRFRPTILSRQRRAAATKDGGLF